MGTNTKANRIKKAEEIKRIASKSNIIFYWWFATKPNKNEIKIINKIKKQLANIIALDADKNHIKILSLGNDIALNIMLLSNETNNKLLKLVMNQLLIKIRIGNEK